MTASIVGWAHMPFGKFDAETVEKHGGPRRDRSSWPMPGISALDVDEIVLGHFNAGFSPQDFTASLVLQADPATALQARHPRRECLCHWFGRRASGHQVRSPPGAA